MADSILRRETFRPRQDLPGIEGSLFDGEGKR